MTEINKNTDIQQMTIEDIVNIVDPTITKLDQYVNNMFGFCGKDGNVDFNALYQFCSYNIGFNYNRVSSLVLQAEHTQKELEIRLDEAMAVAIDDIKRGKNARGYEVTSNEAKDLQEAHPAVLKIKRALGKQITLVAFLKRTLDSLKFFPGNAKIIKEMYEAKLQYGSAR